MPLRADATTVQAAASNPPREPSPAAHPSVADLPSPRAWYAIPSPLSRSRRRGPHTPSSTTSAIARLDQQLPRSTYHSHTIVLHWVFSLMLEVTPRREVVAPLVLHSWSSGDLPAAAHETRAQRVVRDRVGGSSKLLMTAEVRRSRPMRARSTKLLGRRGRCGRRKGSGQAPDPTRPLSMAPRRSTR